MQRLLETVEEIRGTYLVTADHGNAEDMVQRDKKTKKALMEDGKPRMLTSHTLNPVGSVLCSRRSPVPSELCQGLCVSVCLRRGWMDL